MSASEDSFNSQSSDSDSIYSDISETFDSKVVDMSRNRDRQMLKQVLKRGKGWSTPRTGDEVKVHYIASLENGIVLQSTRDRDQPLIFTVGHKQVVKGLDVGIKTMRSGEISKFTFGPEYVLRPEGNEPSIPPNSTVIYEVELFHWKLIDVTEKRDKGVLKRIINIGLPYDIDLPNDGSTCDIHIVGKYEGIVFEEREVQFVRGEASEAALIEGIDIGVRKMRKLEKCELFVKPEYAFGPNGKTEFNIPKDYKQVVYEITLNDFQNAKESHEMNEKEIFEFCESLRKKANDFIKDSKYGLALNKYLLIIKIMKRHKTHDQSQRVEFLLTSYQNSSLSLLKLERYDGCIKYCNLGLKLNPKNAKTLFRRGLAFYYLKDYRRARNDFTETLKLEPNNKSARNHLIITNNSIKAENQFERNIYKNLFANKDQKLDIKGLNACQGMETNERSQAQSSKECEIEDQLNRLSISGDITADHNESD